MEVVLSSDDDGVFGFGDEVSLYQVSIDFILVKEFLEFDHRSLKAIQSLIKAWNLMHWSLNHSQN